MDQIISSDDLTENKEHGYTNQAFEQDKEKNGNSSPPSVTSSDKIIDMPNGNGQVKRDTWDKPIEFLLSCIALSVGLGNIWRFPFTALENGGGAFLIPYLIILLFIGKPLYFLEMILGQFSSYGSVKVWEVVPIAKGVGYGQAIAVWCVVTYYCSLMAISVFYFFASFQEVLPWSQCSTEWSTNETCYSTNDNLTGLDLTGKQSSSELYFTKYVLNQLDNIDNGIGVPEWRLTLCLIFSWIAICLILIKGVSSSGKVAYFTALFPYAVLITLLIRGVTLPGAGDGILYFITPQWEKLASGKVWYAAVTQCFFSLSVGFGPIITYSSYNPFRHRIYRDSTIVSLMDTFTSILAGVTIFSILGNLAYESGKPVNEVVKGGTGLAFISYPEAISKFDAVPQLFAVLFFLMLFTLAVGSAVSLTGCIVTIICDAFHKWKRWIVTILVSIAGFLIGLVYVTPGGLYILDLVDYFGGGFIIYIMVIVQTSAICWVYGLSNLLQDIRFMLGIKLSIYWTFTWGIFIPIALLVIFIYAMVTYEPLKIGDKYYPDSALIAGWVVTAFALLQIPGWALYVVYKQKNGVTWLQKFQNSFKTTNEWGPKDPVIRAEWIQYKQNPYKHSWLPKKLTQRKK